MTQEQKGEGKDADSREVQDSKAVRPKVGDRKGAGMGGDRANRSSGGGKGIAGAGSQKAASAARDIMAVIDVVPNKRVKKPVTAAVKLKNMRADVQAQRASIARRFLSVRQRGMGARLLELSKKFRHLPELERRIARLEGRAQDTTPPQSPPQAVVEVRDL